jgi:GNAT superfamily N-acetyltransferase
VIEVDREEIVVTTDVGRMDLDVIHGFLAGSYWARGITRETVERSMQHSLCFAALHRGAQVGFARVVTDQATFAYVCDVFVHPSCRGRGVGKRLMAAIMGNPALQGLRRWILFTRDAHGLYYRFGFREARHPERLMEVFTGDPDASAGPVK